MLVRHLIDPHAHLQDEMDRLFERFFTPDGSTTPRSLHPHRAPELNIWSDGDVIVLEAELPGLTESDIDVSVHGTQLEIRGERAAFEAPEGATLHRRERPAGRFHRVIHLPMDIDRDAIEARCRHGVLTITMPKTAVTRTRRIPVTSAGA